MKKNGDPLFMESERLVFEMEGRQTLHLRVNCFSFWITKLSVFRLKVVGGYVLKLQGINREITGRPSY